MNQFNKSSGNINNLSDFTCDNATIHNLTVDNIISPVNPTGVYSTNIIQDNKVIVGDGGNRNIKSSTLSVDKICTRETSFTEEYMIDADENGNLRSSDMKRNNVMRKDSILYHNHFAIIGDNTSIIRTDTRFSMETYGLLLSCPIKGNFNIDLLTSPNGSINMTTYGTTNNNINLTTSSGGQINLKNNTQIGLSGNTTTTLAVNKIISVGTDDDIILDANGRGKIKLNSLVNSGIEMTSINNNNENWICCSQYTAQSDRYLVSGTYLSANEWQPTIGAHNSSLTQWMPLWVNIGSSSIFGQAASTVAAVNNNKVYVVGNTETTGVLRCNSLYVNNVQIVPTTAAFRNVHTSFNEQTVSVPSTITLATVVFPFGVSNINRVRIAVRTSVISPISYVINVFDGFITGPTICNMSFTEISTNSGKVQQTTLIGTPNPSNGTSTIQLQYVSGAGSITIMSIIFEFS